MYFRVHRPKPLPSSYLLSVFYFRLRTSFSHFLLAHNSNTSPLFSLSSCPLIDLLSSLTKTSLHYLIPNGVGAAARCALNLSSAIIPCLCQQDLTTNFVFDEMNLARCSNRISNELGAGNPHEARGVVWGRDGSASYGSRMSS